MSTKYRYNTLKAIPAPMVEVKITNPALRRSITDRGKIDTGADLSAIPYHIVEDLVLEPMGTRRIVGYNRAAPPEERPIYYVDAEVAGYVFESVQMISTIRPDVLIGRNILNKLRLTLDGKNYTFEISDPPTLEE